LHGYPKLLRYGQWRPLTPPLPQQQQNFELQYGVNVLLNKADDMRRYRNWGQGSGEILPLRGALRQVCAQGSEGRQHEAAGRGTFPVHACAAADC
jgi:hypothetical protein